MSPVCTGTPPAAAEDELARGLAAGDETCLAVAYERWSALVHALARRSLGDTVEAEDVTQQVFLRVWRGRHGYPPERGAVGAWIVGITRRRIADALSARTRRADLAASAGTAPALAGGSPGRGEDSEAALDRAGPTSRAAAAGPPPGLLRGPHPDADRGTHGPAPGHGQEPHPARAATPARTPDRERPHVTFTRPSSFATSTMQIGPARPRSAASEPLCTPEVRAGRGRTAARRDRSALPPGSVPGEQSAISGDGSPPPPLAPLCSTTSTHKGEIRAE
jgi:RNA polymerase sigma-70 factor (ECF subfamily)